MTLSRCQNTRQPRMERQLLQPVPERRHGVIHKRTQACQQEAGGIEPVRRRRIEPVEIVRTVPRSNERQQHRREVDTVNLGLTRWSQPIAGILEPPHPTGAESCRAPGTLVGTVLRDAFQHQGIDGSRGVVPRHFLQAAVDDDRDIRHSQ